jgi:hypothetical protein
VKIDLLYFDGCPSWQAGLEKLRSALQALGLETSMELIQVMDNDDAARRKFLGPPSFCVNGVALWEEKRDTYSLSCRVYATPEGIKGSPTVSMLQEAIRRIVTTGQE